MLWSVILIFCPFLAALSLVRPKSLRGQGVLGITAGVVSLVASLLNFGAVRSGPLLAWRLASPSIFEPALRVDALSSLFSLFSSLVWLAVGIYMYSYMKHERSTTSFYVFYLLTLGAVQGIFLAGNFVTLLVFFEIMTVTSFFWVIHRQDKEALRSGYFYLFLGILAGLLLAGAIVLLMASGTTLEIGLGAHLPANETMFSWAILLLLVGFGIKAGMVPLHIWLPMAHPVAPTPGSALLSGILIKAGAYGLIRTGQLVNWSITGFVPWLGLTVVILGTLTMLLGVGLALLQSNAKRLLAYHSVSQMGYIILGIGAALVLGSEGAYGVSGAIFHSLNHALFKSALFLGVGIIYLGTGELDLYKMGGLWRKYPLTGVMMLIAAFGITGTPGLNGFISKSLIHHGILEAALTGQPLLIWAERIFLVVGVGTTASFVKLISLTFLGKGKGSAHKEVGEGPFLTAALTVLSVAMLGIGIWPNWVMDLFITPATLSAGFLHVGSLVQVSFFASSAVWDMFITLAVGLAFYGFGMKANLFHFEPPTWLSVEAGGRWLLKVYQGVEEKISSFYKRVSKFVGVGIRRNYRRLMAINRRLDWEGGGIFTVLNFSNLNSNAFLMLTVFTAVVLYYIVVLFVKVV